MRKTFVLTSLLVAVAINVAALPQFALLSGNRCSNCHVSPAGGGLRTEMGWYTMHDVGLIKREALPFLYPDDQSNTILDEQVIFGADARLQSTRSFYDSNASRVLIPMQLTVYGAYKPTRWLTVEGSFNAAALHTRSGTPVRFPGQRLGLASAMVSINRSIPTLRVGMIRPSFGIRYDDHTVFPFSYATPRARQNIISPDWGEWGSELTWEYLRWLTVQVGVYGAQGLAQTHISNGIDNVPTVKGNNPTVTGRIYTSHQFSDNAANMYAGASILTNNDFRMISAFAGAAVTDHVYLMADVVQTHKLNVLTSTMGMVEVGWSVDPSVIAYARYEHGTSDQSQMQTNATLTSGVFGAQVFVLPFMEIRPEYRIMDTFYSGINTRWNVQLHLFY